MPMPKGHRCAFVPSLCAQGKERKIAAHGDKAPMGRQSAFTQAIKLRFDHQGAGSREQALCVIWLYWLHAYTGTAHRAEQGAGSRERGNSHLDRDDH
jgi:hypothetical protein